MSGFVTLDESKADMIRSIGAIPSKTENLMDIFLSPMLDTLQPLQPAFYSLSMEGEMKYDELSHPDLRSLGYAAICIRDAWFIMIAEWRD